MVVKRISRRRKKSSSPRRKSRRKSKQKKRSHVKKKSVRRRSKNKLEGGTSLLNKIRTNQDAATAQLLSEYERENPGVDSSMTFPENIVAAREWKEGQKKKQKDDAAKKRKDDLALLGEQFKQGVKDAKDSIEEQRAQDLKNLKKTGRKIRGKTYVLLVKKNVKEGSTCVYKPKDEGMTFEDLVEMIEQTGAMPPISEQEKIPGTEGLSQPDDKSAGEQVLPVSDDVKKENVKKQAGMIAKFSAKQSTL